MRSPRPLTTAEVLAARAALTRGAPDRDARFRALLGRPARRARTVREWHDLLLFLRAHPHAADVPALADDALRALVQSLDSTQAEALGDSGVAGTPSRSAFSWPLVRWLVARDPSMVRLDAIDATHEVLSETVRLLLPPVEHETPDLLHAADAEEFLRATLGDDRAGWLPRLVAMLEAAPLGAGPSGDAWRSHVFARLGLTVRVCAPTSGVTFARAPHGPAVLLPSGPQRAADVHAACAEPPAREVRLDAAQRAALIDTARLVLASLQRETDPVTHAETVTLHDMGRGLRIALFPLAPAVRLPFDSYVGLVAFRNGVPLAYGGAWIYPGRSKVGINVFPAMRGGESAWFFTQLLRLYHERFAVRVFEAENYQLGHGNAEGLRSGAYWFYYRLGFRPTDPRLARVAAREFARLQARRAYAVPLPVLRELVADGLELTIAPDPVAPTDTAALTLAVQRHVVTAYGGDRPLAERRATARLATLLPRTALRTWSPAQRDAFARWRVALDAISDLAQWTPTERRALLAVVRHKGDADERRHQALLRAHPRLLDAWRRLASAGD